MIPYDDLVAALTSWRARQGLPVASTPAPGSGPTAVPQTGSGAYSMPGSGAYAQAGSGATAMPGSGPVAKPGSGPTRSGPPSAPPKGSYAPPPLADPDDATSDDSLDVDEAALLEEAQYENEGADYNMSFGNVERDDESTTLGHAPEPGHRDSFGGETELDPGSLAGKPRKPW